MVLGGMSVIPLRHRQCHLIVDYVTKNVTLVNGKIRHQPISNGSNSVLITTLLHRQILGAIVYRHLLTYERSKRIET